MNHYTKVQDDAIALMSEAFRIAQNSTCARRRVGAVITSPDNTRVIATGWNHSVSGESCEAKFFKEFVESQGYTDTVKHKALFDFIHDLQYKPYKAHMWQMFDCKDPEVIELWRCFAEFTKTPEFKDRHWSYMDGEIHSEMHAILSALKQGDVLDNCILYSSRSPCVDCAKAIIEVGIKKVYYAETSLKGLSGGLAMLDTEITIEHLDVKHGYYT